MGGDAGADDDYTRAERLADAVMHWLGLALALMSAPVLITLAAVLDGSGSTLAAVSVYAAALLAMIGISAAYHMIPVTTWREVLRRCDHATIYVKIAATQTPFAVFVGGDRMGWTLGALWSAALAGAAGKLFVPDRMRRIAVPLYLLLGWAGLMLMAPGGGGVELAVATKTLIVIGGALYSLGVVFFLWERLRFHNAIWHGFVLLATFVFYAAVVTELGVRYADG